MNRFYSIDGFKVIAAFMVICIHYPLSGLINEFGVPLARVAVPYFLISSGFFMWAPDKEGVNNKIAKSLTKILKYVLLANILYLGWSFSLAYISGNLIEYVGEIFSIDAMINFMVFNESPFAGHLWYLFAYVYVLLVFYGTNKHNLTKYIFYLIPLLLLSDLVLGKYSLVFLNTELPYIIVRNFMFVGIPYFFIGYFIRKLYEQNKLKLNNQLLILGLLLFSLTTIMEKYILLTNNVNAVRDHYLSTTLLVVTIFLYLLNNPNLFKDTSFLKISTYTFYIYIIHPIFIAVVTVAIRQVPSIKAEFAQFLGLILVLLMSLSISMLYVYGKTNWINASKKMNQAAR